MLAYLGIGFVLLLLLGTPVAVALGLASFIALGLGSNVPMMLVPQRMLIGLDISALLSIPLFILAGELMRFTGIMEDLVNFSYRLVGSLRGGMAHVTILTSMLFSGISGSGVADASAVGSVMIPAMDRSYQPRFSAAVVASAAAIGPIIPPSIPMILYALMAPGGMSLGALFTAGVFPGLIIGFGLMGVSYMLAPKYQVAAPNWDGFGSDSFWLLALKVIPATLLPIIIVGGIITGIFTATEAGGVATVYALLYGVIRRTLRRDDLIVSARATATTTAMALFMVAAANAMAWILAAEQSPLKLGQLLNMISSSPWVFLLLTNLTLLLMGMVMESVTAMLLLIPTFVPLAAQFGIDPLHFAIVFVMNAVIGGVTPPVGILLFVVTGISRKTSLSQLSSTVIPFVLWQIAVLAMLTFGPGLALWLPRLLGAYR